MADPGFVAGLRPIPSGPVDEGQRHPAADIDGVGPEGGHVEVQIAGRHRPILLAFLHTRCDGCDEFWRGLSDRPESDRSGGVDRDGWDSDLPGPIDVVIVTKGDGTVDPGQVAALAAGITRSPVVMSDQAWSDYRVLSYPFFVLVDPVGARVVGETVGFGWADVMSMVRSSMGSGSSPGP